MDISSIIVKRLFWSTLGCSMVLPIALLGLSYLAASALRKRKRETAASFVAGYLANHLSQEVGAILLGLGLGILCTLTVIGQGHMHNVLWLLFITAFVFRVWWIVLQEAITLRPFPTWQAILFLISWMFVTGTAFTVITMIAQA